MTTDRPFLPRRPPDDRPSYPRPPYRAPAPGGARPNSEPSPTPSSVRLHDGEREIEVSGTAPFVRQILDDLPVLLARLRGEVPPTPAAIRMPQPSPEPPPAGHPHAVETPTPAAAASPAPPEAPADGDGTELEAQVLAALRGSAHPLAVAGIRERLGLDVSGQQVRRILERAGSKVVATGDKPIRYRLRSARG